MSKSKRREQSEPTVHDLNRRLSRLEDVMKSAIGVKLTQQPARPTRAQREELARSIALWMRGRSVYFGGCSSASAILTLSTDLLNGEWDEETAGGQLDPPG